VNGFSLASDIFFMDAGKRMKKKQKRQEKRTEREAWNMAKRKSCYFVCMSYRKVSDSNLCHGILTGFFVEQQQ
jgi:hypothetical protein